MSEGGDPLEVAFTEAVRACTVDRDRTPTLTRDQAWAIFDAQLQSRHLDLTARWLRQRGLGFYTIGSAGHESNAAVAAALRPTDPALLHYRSGGFYAARAQQVPGIDAMSDVLRGMLASVDEPIAGGRHKVFGREELAIIPQTSTIASHLPRAVGVAFTIGRAPKVAAPTAWPADAVVVCSFGDASANHSTAVGAINTACHCAYQHLPLPLLFVCEDNGLGISVRTPVGWIETAYGTRPHLRFASVDGADPDEVHAITTDLAGWVRREQRPAFLHLRTVRFLGHAGTDVESSYRSAEDLRRDLRRDPLVGTARLLVACGYASVDDVLAEDEAMRNRVRQRALELSSSRPLGDASEVMAPLAPRSFAALGRSAAAEARRAWFGASLPEDEGPLTLAQSINRTLADELLARPGMLVFGEDVAAKGGVYGVTRGLLKKAGAARVFDTLLDEQSILGLALGAGVSGWLPVPEIQYLAYLHNAEDQLRGEAASLSFFSNGQYQNPLVVRIAGYAYQKGFGGHFHNDSGVAVLRDIPGLVIASPARAGDAAPRLRTCLAHAEEDGAVCVFLEPIALYHTTDLHEEGDGGWLDPYMAPGEWAHAHVPLGSARVYGDGTDLLMVSWANGLAMSLRVARRLADLGVAARVLDLRWLAPLPHEEVLRQATETGRVLVVDETRHSGGVGEAVLSGLVERRYAGAMARVAAYDSFVPLGDAARHVLVSETDIEEAAKALVTG
jgi:2-oxoisovalerate dehydrogenase E1 component